MSYRILYAEKSSCEGAGTEDCARYKSPQIPTGNVIFIFTYYFVTFLSNGICCQEPRRIPWTFCLMHLICSRMFPWNFFVKYASSLCGIWKLTSLMRTECIIRCRGLFTLSHGYRWCRPWHAQLQRHCEADLCTSFFSAVLRVTRGEHMGE